MKNMHLLYEECECKALLYWKFCNYAFNCVCERTCMYEWFHSERLLCVFSIFGFDKCFISR